MNTPMRYLPLAAALVGTVPDAAAPASAASAQAPASRGVDDPRAFVLSTYRSFARSEESMPWPEATYSDRLRRLFAAYDAWTAQQQDLIGELDFDWWIDAQDWGIADVRVSETIESANRRIETVRFTHAGERPDEIRLIFLRQNGRWFLDDARQGSGGNGDGWTLSALLRARPH